MKKIKIISISLIEVMIKENRTDQNLLPASCRPTCSVPSFWKLPDVSSLDRDSSWLRFTLSFILLLLIIICLLTPPL